MSCTKHKILKVEDEIILSRVMLAASCLQEDTPDNVRRLVKIEAIRRKSTGDLSHTSFRTIIISSVKACKNQVMTHWRTKSRNCSEIATKEITTETPEWGTPFFLFLSNGLLFSFQSFKGLGDKASSENNGAAWKIRRRGKLSSAVSKKMSKRGSITQGTVFLLTRNEHILFYSILSQLNLLSPLPQPPGHCFGQLGSSRSTISKEANSTFVLWLQNHVTGDWFLSMVTRKSVLPSFGF